jgi:hypothetical protein
MLENRLDKAMIKYNEAQAIRKTYEQIVKVCPKSPSTLSTGNPFRASRNPSPDDSQADPPRRSLSFA